MGLFVHIHVLYVSGICRCYFQERTDNAGFHQAARSIIRLNLYSFSDF